jgi:Transposase IS4
MESEESDYRGDTESDYASDAPQPKRRAHAHKRTPPKKATGTNPAKKAKAKPAEADDCGFVAGWHCPTTDRKPRVPLSPMSARKATFRRAGEATRNPNPTPYQLFKLYFTDEVLDHIVACTNDFRKSLPKDWVPITKPALLRFLALTVTFGMNKQPQVRNYWNWSKFGEFECATMCAV